MARLTDFPGCCGVQVIYSLDDLGEVRADFFSRFDDGPRLTLAVYSPRENELDTPKRLKKLGFVPLLKFRDRHNGGWLYLFSRHKAGKRKAVVCPIITSSKK